MMLKYGCKWAGLDQARSISDPYYSDPKIRIYIRPIQIRVGSGLNSYLLILGNIIRDNVILYKNINEIFFVLLDIGVETKS